MFASSPSCLATVVLQAKGKYIWLVATRGTIEPVEQRLPRTHFVDEIMNCALPSSSLGRDGVPNIYCIHVVKLDGASQLRVFNKKSGRIFPLTTVALFRKGALIKLLRAVMIGGKFI